MGSALTESVRWTMGGVLGLLVVASVVVVVLRRRRAESNFTELTQRVVSWWIMTGIFFGAMIVSRQASVALFALVSFLALKEYLSVIPTRRADRRVLFYAYLAIPIQYYWVSIEWYGLFVIFVPVFMFLVIPLRMVLIGETEGFLRAVGTIHWGLMTTLFSISHAAYLLVLPSEGNPAGGGPGLLLFLMVITELNDISQYCWGKAFGRRKVVPNVSPNKTWGGLVGGIATSVALSLALAPWLTPFNTYEAISVGLLIGLFGFVGDVTISALKRDLAIKDSGSIIPGHGGILDRIDSLSYTAPLFFHFVHYTHY